MLIFVLANLVLLACVPAVSTNLKNAEIEYISSLLRKESEAGGYSSGVVNYYTAEYFWREKLRYSAMASGRDRAMGVGFVRLANILKSRARLLEIDTPKEVELLYKRGIEIENNLGGTLYYFTYATEGLAEYYEENGEYDKSEALLKQKLRSVDRQTDSRRAMGIVIQLVEQFIKQNRWSEGIGLLTNEFRERESIGISKYETPENLSELAKLYYWSGNYTKAVDTCEEAIRVYGEAIRYTPTRLYFAASLRKLGRLNEAKTQFQIDLKDERQRQMWDGKTSRKVHIALGNASDDLHSLGEICVEQGEYSEAEVFFKEALQIGLWQAQLNERISARKKSARFVRRVCSDLEKLYTKLNRPDKARIMAKFTKEFRLLPLDPYTEGFSMPI